MVEIFPFRAMRPKKGMTQSVASVPYDVVTREEAEAIISDNPRSFLRVIRTDAELPEIDPDDERVYTHANEVFESFISNGLLINDPSPGYYIYSILHDGIEYTGLVCCVSTDDYVNRVIKRHELTRYDKEADRTRHIDKVNANTGLVYLLYRDIEGIHDYVFSLIRTEPEEVAENPKGVIHRIYRISDPHIHRKLEDLFSGIESLYIADGHHRGKSAVNVAELRKNEARYSTESGKFMVVMFAHDRVKIHGYSRLVKDLGGLTIDDFIGILQKKFKVERYDEVNNKSYQISPLVDDGSAHVMHLYTGNGRWYEVQIPIENPEDLIGSLDVTVIQEKVMEEILGITDPRGDPRLSYMGGAKPLSGLENAVDSGDYVLAFAMQPVRIDQVLEIADNEGVMPPKSTWFEPKLLSGLLIHKVD